MILKSLHHVQLAMPEGGEEAARAFFCGLLGMREVAKPPSLAGRGGIWCEIGTLRLHVGVEPDFRPAQKAHPAIEVSGLADLADRLQRAGLDLRWDVDLPGFDRFYAADPFGNRIEFLQPAE